ncbi:hypothetical protein ACFQ6N_09230 [Kitasatospora sp. NPDC056446]|uniref:hypothetical protein n=1 Tax=Kitasatospora sp. NPDC056446 TaxID=3345819 RepID=UPI003679F075
MLTQPGIPPHAEAGRQTRAKDAQMPFADDDGKTLGEVQYAYDIAQNWPAAE